MDTFKLFVFVLTYIALISIQTNVDATLGADCSTDTSVCETSNNEICSGTCVCGDAFYESETLCATRSNLGENCTEDNQCISEFAICVENTTCDCSVGYFDDGNNMCGDISALKPYGLYSPTQTEISVTLTWTPPAVTDYTSSYIINYNLQSGSDVEVHNVNGDNTQTTVSNLSPGTTYIFTVIRIITKDGRTQYVPESDPLTQATKSTPKGYGEICTAGSTDECQTGLNCASTFNKCLCAVGSYYTETTCSSNDALKPVNIQANTKTYNSVVLSWTSTDAAGYTNSHIITYSKDGTTQTHNVNAQDTFTNVPNLDPGTTYIFTVVRSIIREGRTQTVPASDLFTVTTNGVDSDSCVAVGESTECGPGLVCVSGTGNRCLCLAGNYYTGSFCTSTDALKPTLTSPSQTLTEVSLTWTAPVASGYTNSYVINYITQGGTQQTYTVDGQSTAATVPNLNPGTTYTFTVVRSITRNERTQRVESDDLVQSTQKLDYGSACTGDQCRSIFSCITGKCLCADGSYYISDSCVSIPKPSITDIQPTSTNRVTINWNSPPVTGYINSYFIKYTEEGTTVVQTSPVPGDVSTHLVTGLKPGTSYTFKVVRYITREGRTQTGIESLGVRGTSEKINYGDACVLKGTCKNLNTDCYFSTCRCDPGYFWDENCLQNANLIPGNINTETLSTTQLRVTWAAPSYPDVVTGYLVELSPPVSSENIVISGTSATISSLTPGERYMVTVSSRSSYLDRGETAPAGVKTVTMKPATTSGLTLATSLMAPVAHIHFHQADGRSDSYTVTLTGDGYRMEKTSNGDMLSASFPGVSAGFYYDLTIITNSYDVSSDPFTQRIRVRAEASEAVVGLSVSGVTSRGASLTWKRPVNTKGALYKYGIEVFNSSTCVQRINIECAVCKDSMKVTETIEIRCERETYTEISQSNLNNVNFVVHYDLVLLPDTVYNVFVSAYNEDGRGTTTKESVQTIQGAPSFVDFDRPVIRVQAGTETEKSVELLTCPTCILDNTNGVIIKSGILVCVKGDCPIRDVKDVKTADSYDTSPNWDTTTGVDFTTWYRATEDDWLNGKEDSNEIRFILGGENCGVEDQNRFCNGPLPVDRTYRVWIFACTRVSCVEGDHLEFTLANENNSLPGSIIAAIVAAVVLVVLAAVILVVYIKVIRPRSQRQRSTPYVSDTPPKDDTYEEIGNNNKLSVIKDGRPEVDYYNMKDNPPRSENTYDQLKVYSNQGHHDYGRIKVTQT